MPIDIDTEMPLEGARNWWGPLKTILKKIADNAVTTLDAISATDAALAASANSSTSATRAAFDGLYGRKRSTMHEMYDDYSGYANGAVPARALTGQAYSLHSGRQPAGYPIISGGYLTYASSDYLGGYATVQLENSAIRVGASFAFTPWTTGGGLAALAVMEKDIRLTSPNVPRSPFHLTVSPEGWGFDVFPTEGAGPVSVATGLFTPNLVADGTTLHRVEGIIDREAQTIYLTLPDGSRKKITNANIGIAAKFVFVEPFRDTSAAGKTLAKFRNFWADSRSAAPIPAAKAESIAPAAVAGTKLVIDLLPGSAANKVLANNPDATSKVTGTDFTITFPASGNVEVTITALIDITTNGEVNLGLLDSTNTLVAVRTVGTKTTHSGLVSLTLGLSGTPGSTISRSVSAYKAAAAVATLILGASAPLYGGLTVSVKNL